MKFNNNTYRPEALLRVVFKEIKSATIWLNNVTIVEAKTDDLKC